MTGPASPFAVGFLTYAMMRATLLLELGEIDLHAVEHGAPMAGECGHRDGFLDLAIGRAGELADLRVEVRAVAARNLGGHPERRSAPSSSVDSAVFGLSWIALELVPRRGDALLRERLEERRDEARASSGCPDRSPWRCRAQRERSTENSVAAIAISLLRFVMIRFL